MRMKTSGSNPGHGVFLLHMHGLGVKGASLVYILVGLGVKGASLVYILVVPTAVDNLFIYAKKDQSLPPSQPQPEM